MNEKRALRILYYEGPGNAKQTFRAWLAGEENRSVTHVAFSRQFFDVCREFDAKAWLIATHSDHGAIEEQGIKVEHRKDVFQGKSGVAYHLAHIPFLIGLARDVLAYRPNIVILHVYPYPFVARFLSLFRISIVVTALCVIWPEFGRVSRLKRILFRIGAGFYHRRGGCRAVISASKAVSRQIASLAGEDHSPLVEFLPQFDSELFGGILPPDPHAPVLTVMFAGRIEESKGVFDLLEVAQRLKREGHDDIRFEICGSGSALEELRRRSADGGVGDRFVLHGWCDQDQMREVFGRSHVMVVPTTTRFVEGFNMVVIEALLAGRPVITSRVCPAIEYVEAAVSEVPPDDVRGYYDAILGLARDRKRYEDLQRHCSSVVERFQMEEYGFAAAFRHIFSAIREGREVASVSIDP